MQYHDHLTSYQSLITPYEKIRSGFIALALEKNRKATPYVEEAKVLKVIAKKAKKPRDLNSISISILSFLIKKSKPKNSMTCFLVSK